MKKIELIQKVFFVISVVFILFLSENAKAQEKTVLKLPEYLKEVQTGNLGYIAERFNIPISEAQLKASGIYPDPEISAGYSNNQDKVVKMGQSVDLGISYPVNLGNKRKANISVSQAQYELSQLVVEAYFQNLRADASKSFFSAIREIMVYQLENETYGQLQKLARFDSIRLAVGDARITDAMQSELEAKAQLNKVFQSEAAMKNSLTDLTILTGKNVNDTLLEPEGDFPEISRDYILLELIQKAVQNRADLQIAIKNREVSEKYLNLLKADRAFEFNVEAGYSYNSMVRNEIAPAPKFNSYSAGIAIPLKFSNINKNAVEAAKMQVSQSEMVYRNVVNQIAGEVTQAFNNYNSFKRQVNQYETGLIEKAGKILESKVYEYQRGQSGLIEVLIAQRTYTSLKMDYLETCYNCSLSLVELERAAGIWDLQ
jgi:cobalt-zinc-cadmium efflux system outer membrane protein